MLTSFKEQVQSRWFVILGLGRAGQTLSRALLKAGAKVAAYEEDERVWNLLAVRMLVKSGLIRLRKLGSRVVSVKPAVIASPGFSAEHPAVRFFMGKGISVQDELDFATQFLKGEVIAVTGTNGKSTTVTMIGEILRQAGKKVFVGGNLAPGKPLSSALNAGGKDFYVVEVSSFQLSRSDWLAPKVAVLLNVTADHLDRHRSFADYARCKARIFERQKPDDWAVLNYDDPVVRELAGAVRARRLFFSLQRRADSYLFRKWVYFQGKRMVPVDMIIERMTGRGLPAARLFRLEHLPVVENAVAAVSVAGALGVESQAVHAGLRCWQPLKHRLEFVRAINGIYFFNNSMCTNPQAGIRSLRAWRNKVVLIAGGKEKDADPAEFVKAMSERAKWVVLLGENSERLAAGLSRLSFHQYEIAYTMKDAVFKAFRQATPGDVVLLSPGFASFDLFRNFQARGRAFKNAVWSL
ncbi:MAG: UDP-N-acetylmuramoyl-L-alanine--D-glutamate ligase [bacterium]|jgi:UDP-N-acetylmuramoylalanine--D-glutamate ligase